MTDIKLKIVIFLTLSLVMLMAIPILATDVNEPYADALAELGLFKGTGNGYELERPPTRAEAITLLIRVLGKEEEALSGDHEHPFADAGWADAYIGYAYENNIAKGISPTEFGASLMIDHKQYSTLLLRVLGYSDDVGGQFTYEQAYEFAAHKLALKCDADRFTRGELVKLTYAALNAPMHRSNKTLAKKLMSDKVFTQGDLAAAKAKLPREDQKTAVLIYAVASDLESKLGMLSMDINEILDAQSANIEILMQTGGTKNYRNTLLQGGRTQRFRISDDRISDINVLDGADMCNRQTFTDFLTYAKENVIADRYVLVMWDHGEGTLGGFGRDELNENASLSLADMKSAIEAFGKNIDIVVFDACLMGTVECAYALSDTCTYLVASEDITPTEGIYYTTWLNSLSNDMSLSTEELARLIVDSFIVHSPKDREDVMMSVIRLDNISILTDELARTLQRISDNKIAERLAIAELVPYGDNDGYDQYDLLGVFDKIDVDISDLAVALERTLYYKRSAKDGKYSGMALYLPLKRKDDYADVRNVLNEIEYPEGLISVLDTINETNGG